MELSRLFKWVVVLVVILAIWKYVIPWVKSEANSIGSGSAASAASASGGNTSCISAADRASSAWGGGIGRFVNPPYNMEAWSNFKSDIDSKITAAESECACSDDSCRKVKSAMSDLRSLVSDLDNAIRGGTSPGQDIVQRQEQIDRQIDDAREIARAGK